MRKIETFFRCVLDSKVLLCCILLSFALVRLFLYGESIFRGLNTDYDEGFYYFLLETAQNDNIDSRTSLGAFFISSILPSHFTYYLVNIRLFSFLLSIIGMFSFAAITGVALKNAKYISCKIDWVIYFSIVFLLAGCMADVDTTNPLQYFFLELEIAFFILALCCPRTHLFSFFAVGFMGVFALLTIPPSGGFVFLSIAITTFVVLWNNKRRLWRSVIATFFGCMASWAVVHFFVLDLRDVFTAFFNGASELTTSNRGYGLKDHFLRMSFFIRDFFILSCLLGGLCYCYKTIAKHSQMVAVFILFIGLIIFSLYQKKPVFLSTILFLFPCVVLFPSVCFDRKITWETAFVLALLTITPLLSILGTNVSYSIKIGLFLASLSIPFFIFINEKTQWRICVLIMLIFPTCIKLSERLLDKKEYVYSDFECLKHIKIQPIQIDHFNTVDSILKQTNYCSETDYFYASVIYQFAVCTANGRLISVFHQPTDFLTYQHKEMLPTPNYIFFNSWDSACLYQPFSEMGWGFPEEFERYPTPHPTWSNLDGYLYCRKSKIEVN